MKLNKNFLAALITGVVIGFAGISVAQNNPSGLLDKIKFSDGPKAATKNSGSDAEIKKLKNRVIELIEASSDIGNLDPKIKGEIGNGRNDARAQKLYRDLSKIWATPVVNEKYDQIIKMYQADDGNALDLTFDSVTYNVISWDGVQVTGNTAHVAVTGFSEYRKGSHLSTGTTDQTQISLTRDADNGAWLILDRVVVRIED